MVNQLSKVEFIPATRQELRTTLFSKGINFIPTLQKIEDGEDRWYRCLGCGEWARSIGQTITKCKCS